MQYIHKPYVFTEDILCKLHTTITYINCTTLVDNRDLKRKILGGPNKIRRHF